MLSTFVVSLLLVVDEFSVFELSSFEFDNVGCGMFLLVLAASPIFSDSAFCKWHLLHVKRNAKFKFLHFAHTQSPGLSVNCLCFLRSIMFGFGVFNWKWGNGFVSDVVDRILASLGLFLYVWILEMAWIERLKQSCCDIEV